jgi:hypothetical protein
MMWTIGERPDLNFPVKELARHVQNPTQQDWGCLKRLLRYICGTLHAELHLEVDPDQNSSALLGISDANWASDITRHSTSGGLVAVQGFLLQHWSRTQATIAQSSCESELLGMNMCATELCFVRSLCEELHTQVQLQLLSDSSSAVAVTFRRGLGRLRHLDVRQLWLQQQQRDGAITIGQVDTDNNIADLFTKALGNPRFRRLVASFGLVLEPTLPDVEQIPSTVQIQEIEGEVSALEEDEELTVSDGFELLLMFLGVWMMFEIYARVRQWLLRLVPMMIRDVATQSQTTHTALRGVTTPRFLPLPERSHGATVGTVPHRRGPRHNNNNNNNNRTTSQQIF